MRRSRSRNGLEIDDDLIVALREGHALLLCQQCQLELFRRERARVGLRSSPQVALSDTCVCVCVCVWDSTRVRGKSTQQRVQLGECEHTLAGPRYRKACLGGASLLYHGVAATPPKVRDPLQHVVCTMNVATLLPLAVAARDAAVALVSAEPQRCLSGPLVRLRVGRRVRLKLPTNEVGPPAAVQCSGDALQLIGSPRARCAGDLRSEAAAATDLVGVHGVAVLGVRAEEPHGRLENLCVEVSQCRPLSRCTRGKSSAPHTGAGGARGGAHHCTHHCGMLRPAPL